MLLLCGKTYHLQKGKINTQGLEGRDDSALYFEDLKKIQIKAIWKAAIKPICAVRCFKINKICYNYQDAESSVLTDLCAGQILQSDAVQQKIPCDGCALMSSNTLAAAILERLCTMGVWWNP